jgi:hypothetical protein
MRNMPDVMLPDAVDEAVAVSVEFMTTNFTVSRTSGRVIESGVERLQWREIPTIV